MAAQTCLRCGAPVDPDDTVCFNCGAPIGESKTPTQPVNVPRATGRAAPSQPSAPSGLPAPASSVAALPLPTRPLPAVSATPAARTGNRWVLLLLGAVLLALLAAGAGLALRATLAAPPVGKTALYRDPAHRFSFERPALWTVTTEPGGVLLTDSDGTSAVTISVSAPSGDETAADAASALATATPGLASGQGQQIGGQGWVQLSGQMTGSDGAVRQVAIYVTVRNGSLYTITCSCPVASFDATNNLVFQPLLASFVFH